jgi:hypothetical protein
MDKTGKWYEGKVVAIHQNGDIAVHFKGEASARLPS